MTTTSSIEILESRIAPASVLNYVDVDGDKVKVTSSSATGDLNAGGVAVFSDPDAADPRQLQQLVLGAAFAGTNLTFAVTKGPNGDGQANVGLISATGVDLGNVTIKGDLGQIDCGDGVDANGIALKSLNVRSLGRFGIATQSGSVGTISNIAGSLGALKVAGDVVSAWVNVTGAGADLLSVTVGGSVIGGSTLINADATNLGAITADGDLGPVTIGKDLIGGIGDFSGLIRAGAGIKSVTVKGSVIGGGGAFSGMIFAGAAAGTDTLGPVKIGRDLVGGSERSGLVFLTGDAGTLTSVTVGGSIIGAKGDLSGTILAGDPTLGGGDVALGNVTVGGALLGGSGIRSGHIFSDSTSGLVKIGRDLRGGSGAISGSIQSEGTVNGISVGGSLVGGSASEAGEILAPNVTGTIAIKGSLIGGSANATGRIAASDVKTISIGGDLIGGSINGADNLTQSGLIDVSDVGSITIGGSIIVGTDDSSGALTASGSIFAASIGALTVKGSIVGNQAEPATIALSGKAPGDPGFALGSLTVGGRVEWAEITAVDSVAAVNVQIGTLKVAGDWIASSIASGVNPGLAGYGSGDESLYPANISRIAAITIGGSVLGSGAAGDNFAFIADSIGSFKAFGKTFVAPATFSLETGGDVKLIEL